MAVAYGEGDGHGILGRHRPTFRWLGLGLELQLDTKNIFK